MTVLLNEKKVRAEARFEELLSSAPPGFSHQHDGGKAQGKGVAGRAAPITADAFPSTRGLGDGPHQSGQLSSTWRPFFGLFAAPYGDPL